METGKLKSNLALKAGGGYLVGNILIKGINFLSVPLFSRILTTEEFGVYNVFISYDAILFVIIGLALHSSIRSANYEFKGKIDEYTSSISLMPLINFGIFSVIAVVFGGFLSDVMGFERSMVYMLIPYSFGSAILTLYNTRISLDYSYKKYLIAALVNSLGNVGLSLLLVFSVFQDKRDVGRILGATVTIFSLSIVLLVSLCRKAVPKYNKSYWKFAIKYSLPIIPHGISQVLLAQVDRIMIQRIVSSAAAGIYSLAGNIKLILSVITDSISQAWSTWFYEEMDQGKRKSIQDRAVQLSLVFVIFSVGLMALSPELIWILGGEEYMDGKYVAIPMIMDAFILFLYNVIVPSEYYMKKTTYIMTGTIAAAVINLITNYIFIINFGYIAAAYTTLFSYVCYLVFHTSISRRLVKFSVLPLKNMLIDIAVVSAMGVIDLLFIDSILTRYALCVVVMVPIVIYLIFSLKRADNLLHE